MARIALVLVAALGAGAALADDRIALDALVDLRAVHTDSAPSFVYGGLGTVRFDDDHEGVRVGRASLAARIQIAATLTGTVVADAYDDGEQNAVGVSEAFVAWRPFPRSALRWQVKAGAFFLPVSLEHRLIGWSSPYTLSASAINTWIGEEFRVLGTEVEARWLGAPSGYQGDIGLVAGVFGWDEGAGVVIAERGWALTDRPSLLFGHVGRNPADLYYEVDGRPGAYVGVSWHHHEALEVRALSYDNRADPAAQNLGGYQAWRTRFTAVGARWEPLEHFAFLAQHLEGSTAIGPDGTQAQFVQQYGAWYALASGEWGRNRVSVRYDRFTTEQVNGFYGGPLANEHGHAATAAWMYRLSDQWQLAAEWLRVVSDYPPRAELGAAPAETDTQVQLAVRYRLRID